MSGHDETGVLLARYMQAVTNHHDATEKAVIAQTAADAATAALHEADRVLEAHWQERKSLAWLVGRGEL